MSLSRKSINVLRQVKEAVLAEPELYDQSEPPNFALANGGCNSPCCMAGWAVWVRHPDPEVYARIVRVAMGEDLLEKYAGVSAIQACRIFNAPVHNAEECAVWIEDFISRERRS